MKTSNFAVIFTNQEQKENVDRVFNELKLDSDGSNANALERILTNAASHLDDDTMRDNGVDLQALDACLNKVRQQFVTVAQARSTIEEEYRQKYEKLNSEYQDNLSRLQKGITQAELERDEAYKNEDAAIKEKEVAQTTTEQFEKRAITAEKRAEEQSATINRLNSEATVNKEKLEKYDVLLDEKNKLETSLKDKELEIADLKKSFEYEKNALQNKISNIEALNSQKIESLNDKINTVAKEKEVELANANKSFEYEKQALVDKMANMEALFKQEKESLLDKLNSANALADREKQALLEKNKRLEDQVSELQNKVHVLKGSEI